jgi:hypothetical protein
MKRKLEDFLKECGRGGEHRDDVLLAAQMKYDGDHDEEILRSVFAPEFWALVDEVTKEEIDEYEARCKQIEEKWKQADRERRAKLTPHQLKHEDLSRELANIPEEERQEFKLRLEVVGSPEPQALMNGYLLQSIIADLNMEGVERLFKGLPGFLDWAKRSWEHSHKH